MLLTLKMLMAPALVGVASIVAWRVGPAAGGVFAALPLTSGPVLLFMAVERGVAFAARASEGVVLAVAPLTAFALAYAWSSTRLDWRRSSAAGMAAYLAGAWCVVPLSLTSVPAFAVACVLLVVGVRALPEVISPASGSTPPPWDIPIRMVLSAALVLAITAVAASVGPRVSGLLTPFPVAATILAAFTHRNHGAAAAVILLRGLLAGLFSFALFFLIVGAAIQRYGIVAAFTMATAAALLLQLAVHALRWRAVRMVW